MSTNSSQKASWLDRLRLRRGEGTVAARNHQQSQRVRRESALWTRKSHGEWACCGWAFDHSRAPGQSGGEHTAAARRSPTEAEVQPLPEGRRRRAVAKRLECACHWQRHSVSFNA